MRKRRRNPLQVRVNAIRLPKRLKRSTYLKRLLDAISSGEDLPRGWQVEIEWRNPATKNGKTKHWQADDFVDALANSSAGFRNVTARAILSAMGRI